MSRGRSSLTSASIPARKDGDVRSFACLGNGGKSQHRRETSK